VDERKVSSDQRLAWLYVVRRVKERAQKKPSRAADGGEASEIQREVVTGRAAAVLFNPHV